MLLIILSCIGLSGSDQTAVTTGGDVSPTPAVESEQGFMLTRWTVGMQVHSAAVADDGEAVYGAIGGGTVCTFDGDGTMIADSDVSADADLRDSRGNQALAATESGVELLDVNNNAVKRWEVAGVRDAAMREQGVVAVTASAIRWFNDASEVASMPTAGCSSLSLDREADVAWVACGSSVVAYEVDNATGFAVEGGASRVAWSTEAGLLFVVDAAGSQLSAITPEGAVVWSEALSGNAKGLVAVGGTDVAAVLVGGDEVNQLVLVSGVDGSILDAGKTDATRINGAHAQPVLELNGGFSTSLVDVEIGG